MTESSNQQIAGIGDGKKPGKVKKLTIIGEQEEEECHANESSGEADASEHENEDMQRLQATRARIQREKRHRSKQIKKILKERLNIDCLRMLGEEHPDMNIEANQMLDKP